jgi:signal peptidase II
MTPSRAIRLVVIGLIRVWTAGCDQVTKHVARAQLGHAASVKLPSAFLQFTHAENPGAFLGLGAAVPQPARTALSVALGALLACLLAYLVRTPKVRLISFFSLALVCAGGISNLIDRFTRHGLVTDFMLVRAGPLHTGIFNLADFIIVLSILMLTASACCAPPRQTIGGRR